MRTIEIPAGVNVGFTSDTHCGHANILQYCLRPWLPPEDQMRVCAGERVKVPREAVDAHDIALAERANEAVGPSGVLVHAGDVAWGRAHLELYASRLKVGRVLVAVGNHDDEDDLAAVFGRENVFERFCLKVGGQEAVIDHYPGDSWQASHKACWQLFGHVHGASNARRRANPSWALSLDVGVDSHDFRPWMWAELSALFRERKDAWQDWRGAMRDKSRGGMAPVGKP